MRDVRLLHLLSCPHSGAPRRQRAAGAVRLVTPRRAPSIASSSLFQASSTPEGSQKWVQSSAGRARAYAVRRAVCTSHSAMRGIDRATSG